MQHVWKQREGYRDIGDRLAEIERNPSRAAAVAKARKNITEESKPVKVAKVITQAPKISDTQRREAIKIARSKKARAWSQGNRAKMNRKVMGK